MSGQSIRNVWLIGLILGLLLAACAVPEEEVVPTPEAVEDLALEVGGLDELAQNLVASGAEVEPGEQVEVPYYDTPGRVLRVNGAEVLVFEFSTTTEREIAEARITPEGQPFPDANVEWDGEPHFWGAGRVIVLYVGSDEDVINTLSGILGRRVTEPPTAGGDFPPAVEAAMEELAAAQNIPLANIQVETFEATQWPDACLGLPAADETCAQVITPGFFVVLEANGIEYEVRTDETGDVVRIAG